MDYGDQFLVVWTAAAAAATSVQYVGARVHIGSFARPATHQRDVHQADEVVMSLFLLYGMHTNEGWGGGRGAHNLGPPLSTGAGGSFKSEANIDQWGELTPKVYTGSEVHGGWIT